jgi:hypothetical protein
MYVILKIKRNKQIQVPIYFFSKYINLDYNYLDRLLLESRAVNTTAFWSANVIYH